MTLKTGKLSAEEKDEIERLARVMKNPSAGMIASRLNRKTSTIRWHMLARGMVKRKPGRAPAVCIRKGRIVYPWAPEHDAFISNLRRSGTYYADIARMVTEKFGIPRTWHSCHVRLVLLAAEGYGKDQAEAA